MLDSRLYRKLSLTTAVLGFLIAAGCSEQPASGHRSALAAGGAASKAATASPAGNPADAAQTLRLVTLPKGTKITAMVDQTLASNKNHWGDPFEASLTRPIRVDGKTILPRGTEVTGHILEVKSHELKVVLSSVVVDGIYCDLETNSRRPSDKDRPNQNKNNGPKHKDNSKLSARTRLTFKLSKPATIPAKA